MVFGVFLTQKKHRFVSFSTTFGELFLVYSLGKYTRFLVTHPLLAWGWGQKIGQICGVFSSKDSKNAHFLTFLNGYIHPNNFKNKKQALGALPQTPLSLARPQGAGGKPYPPTPTVSVGSIQGVKGKMHDFVALDPSPSPWG